jgi:hypothetical protein
MDKRERVGDVAVEKRHRSRMSSSMTMRVMIAEECCTGSVPFVSRLGDRHTFRIDFPYLCDKVSRFIKDFQLQPPMSVG